MSSEWLEHGFDPVEVKAQLRQLYLMTIRRVRTHRQWQARRSTIAMILKPFPHFVLPIFRPPPRPFANDALI